VIYLVHDAFVMVSAVCRPACYRIINCVLTFVCQLLFDDFNLQSLLKLYFLYMCVYSAFTLFVYTSSI